MAKVKISSLGANVERDFEFTQSSGFSPFKLDSVPVLNTAATASAGASLISGSAARTVQLPLASDNTGAMFLFRITSPHAHVLTASAETAGTRPIVGKDGVVSGSAFTFSNTVGNAVGLWCDGRSYHLMVGSGSVTGA